MLTSHWSRPAAAHAEWTIAVESGSHDGGSIPSDVISTDFGKLTRPLLGLRLVGVNDLLYKRVSNNIFCCEIAKLDRINVAKKARGVQQA